MLVVGFDLDMTLVDSRAGIIDVLCLVDEEHGLGLDADAAVDVLFTSTLDVEFERWFGTRGGPLADRFRELYAEYGIAGTTLLPGAAQAFAAVRRRSGRTVVVTAKYEPNARRCLEYVGLDPDAVFGWLHGADKASALVAEHADIYVGDSPADVTAAHAAAAIAVMVPSGPCTADELTDAGADVVLPDLTKFPCWLGHHLDRHTT